MSVALHSGTNSSRPTLRRSNSSAVTVKVSVLVSVVSAKPEFGKAKLIKPVWKPSRTVSAEALTATGSGEEVVALIETRFAAAPACGHCGATDFKPWGSASGLKRYMCRACERTFNALAGTPLAGLRLREKWLDYARALVDGVSLRKAAARTNIHLETSFRWRHRFLAVAKDKKAAAVTGIVEADETFILKSAKGSRNLVGRAPRKRGGKAKKPGLSTDEHDAILIVRDRHGETTDAMLADLSAETIGAHLKPVVAKDAVLVTDGDGSQVATLGCLLDALYRPGREKLQ